jgi:hypothetical protein
MSKEYELYMQHGGGLGDFITWMYKFGNYELLNNLEGRAVVLLQAHNPFAEELFTLHPKASQIDLISFGYHGSWSAATIAYANAINGRIRDTKEYQGNLLEVSKNHTLQEVSGYLDKALTFPLVEREVSNKVSLFGNSCDRELYDIDYIVFGSGAGEAHRSISVEHERWLIEKCISRGFAAVLTGRSYERFNRAERDYSEYEKNPMVVNLVDQLNVFQTIDLVRHAKGAICCHSFLSMVSWFEAIPQLLIYSKSAEDAHFNPYLVRGDERQYQWVWGATKFYNLSIAERYFDESKEEFFEKFLLNVNYGKA